MEVPSSDKLDELLKFQWSATNVRGNDSDTYTAAGNAAEVWLNTWRTQDRDQLLDLGLYCLHIWASKVTHG